MPQVVKYVHFRTEGESKMLDCQNIKVSMIFCLISGMKIKKSNFFNRPEQRFFMRSTFILQRNGHEGVKIAPEDLDFEFG